MHDRPAIGILTQQGFRDSAHVGLSASFSFSAPIALVIALLLALITAIAVVVRRPAIAATSIWTGAIGLTLIALAAGEPTWRRPSPLEVAVMVDLSPSTRTALFRNRSQLDARIRQLLGRATHRIYYFASQMSQIAPGGDPLPDIGCERTTFQPPAGVGAVVLFSDGRFDLPTVAPPTFVVVDPRLELPADARVTALEVRGRDIAASVTNAGSERRLSFSGTRPQGYIAVAPGQYVLTRPIDPRAVRASTQFGPGDAWPENDQLSILPPLPDQDERWWTSGAGSAPATGWRLIPPTQLPSDPSAYLAPAIIVLDNVAASQLTDLQQQRLAQYVRELGGTLLILGGDHAFAAGGYPGTALDALSPLASTPPEPTLQWIILADSSGSMATMERGVSRWRYVTDAMAAIIPRLPGDDVVSVGSFAERLTWWSAGRSARDTARLPLPPADVFPHGPTNLEPALREVARSAAGTLPKPLLLITDAEARIDDPASLIAQLQQKQVHLHLLAIGAGSGLSVLQTIVNATGGTLIQQDDPRRWTQSAQELMRSASPRLLNDRSLMTRFVGELSAVPPRDSGQWNRTWLKSAATAVAEGTRDAQPLIMGAAWNRGEGRVVALAFGGTDGNAMESIAAAIARAPRDPRYHVTWDAGPLLRVKVEAGDARAYLNGAELRLDLSDDFDRTGGATRSLRIPQTGPGEYELACASPRQPTFATVRVSGRALERFAVAGRYAPEFDAVGNDRAAMQRLAARTGGAVILPDQRSPIDFKWPRRIVSLTSVLAMLGVAFIALSLIRWKMG
jgi:hypothetical protein